MVVGTEIYLPTHFAGLFSDILHTGEIDKRFGA